MRTYTNRYLILSTTQEKQPTISENGGRSPGDQLGGSRDRLPQRHVGGALGAEPGHRNTPAPLSGAVQNFTDDSRGMGGSRNGSSIDNLGAGGGDTQHIYGGQPDDGLAKVCSERVGTSSTEFTDIGSSMPSDIVIDGSGD